MTEPFFLEPEQVLQLHQMAIEASEGEPNVCDWGLLESAVAMPRQGFGQQYLHDRMVGMAAVYFFRIVSNHAFVDGNKRTGCMAALAFLEGNGMRLNVDDKELEDLAVLIAGGLANSKQIAIDFFTAHVVPAAI